MTHKLQIKKTPLHYFRIDLVQPFLFLSKFQLNELKKDKDTK